MYKRNEQSENLKLVWLFYVTVHVCHGYHCYTYYVLYH